MATPTLHPITQTVTRALSRDRAGKLVLDARGEAKIRGELIALERGPALRDALIALVELAFVLEKKHGAPAIAATLRSLASESGVALARQAERSAEASTEAKRDVVERFTRFTGGPAPRATAPRAPITGALRAADLRPRAITGR